MMITRGEYGLGWRRFKKHVAAAFENYYLGLYTQMLVCQALTQSFSIALMLSNKDESARQTADETMRRALHSSRKCAPNPCIASDD
jgi:hypothetical protein